MSEFIRIRIWEVQHGCCATVQHVTRAGWHKKWAAGS